MPRWVEAIAEYKDADILFLSDIDDSPSMIGNAMETTGVPYLDFRPIGQMHKVVNDWLNEGKTLEPLTDKQVKHSDSNNYAEAAVAAECMGQPGVDKNFFGGPDILATLFYCKPLNDYLKLVKQEGLDEDDQFKTELRNLVTSRHEAVEIEDRLGMDNAEGNEEYEAATAKAVSAMSGLADVLGIPIRPATIQEIANP